MKKIKVKDLIKILEKFDRNLPVARSGYRGCSDWLVWLTEDNVEIVKDLVYDYKDNTRERRCLVVG